MKFKLLVESGSTKTDWAVVSEETIAKFSTSGINPASDIELIDLSKESPVLTELADSISEIQYYGAGVIDKFTSKRIADWLNLYFRNISKLTVESDLLGACKATAGLNSGIVSILGTGSNSCLYDGHQITDNIPALGFILSNEGGGTSIGKAILQAYFYRQMPSDVITEFEKWTSITKSQVVQSLYLKKNPTQYLASFAIFLNETKNKEWRKSLLSNSFQDFIDTRIKAYKDYNSYELHFVGSIAYFCQNILRETLQLNDLEATSIVHKPIEGLIALNKKKRDD